MDTRFKAAALLSGGLQPQPREIDSWNFAPRYRVPTLMLNGKQDFFFPYDTNQKVLFDALGTPAVVYPVDGLVDATLHEQTGIVTRQETPDSVAEGVLSLLNRPEAYQEFRERARDRTREFHWDQILPTACDWLEKQATKPGR